MRFSEYVNRSKSRRSLHEDELKDSSYYVSSNGFVTSDIADKIKLSDVAKKMYNDIQKDDVAYSVEKALDGDIKNFGYLYNGGIDAFVNKIYNWARFGKTYRYHGCENADIQALAIILANDWYESRKAKLNLKENCKRKTLKESIVPYNGDSLKTYEKLQNVDSYSLNTLYYNKEFNLWWYINKSDFIYIVKFEKCLAKRLGFVSYRLTKNNTFEQKDTLWEVTMNDFKNAFPTQTKGEKFISQCADKLDKTDVRKAFDIIDDIYNNLKESCKKALKESETYDLEFLKDVLAQCSDAQLADIYNMIVVENLNNCSLASIADSFIAGEDQIYEPFKSLFKKNGIKLDAIYMRYSTIIGTDLPPIDYERFDEYYGGESIESVLKNDLGTYYDVNVYDYGYDSLFVELEDIAIKNVWQKASGIDNLKFATSLLEDIAEDQGIDVIQNYIEENYRIKSAADITPDVVKNAIIAVVLRDLGNCLFMLSELVTFTPKALDAIKKFCKDVDDFYEYWR